MRTTSLNVSLMLLALGLVGRPACESAPAQSYAPREPHFMTSTIEPPASFVLDDPANSAATSSSGGGGDQDANQWDEICHRCLDKVQLAQDNVQIHDNISRKQKKLIAQMKAAVEASVVSAERRPVSRSSVSRNNRSPPAGAGPSAPAPQNGAGAGPQNSTLLARSIQPDNQWVVSTLRVARSAGQPGAGHLRNKDKFLTNKKDAELERLKREQQQQKDKTCNSLIEARDCLDSISRECTGFLQYHMYDVFVDQYHGKLRCPYANNPNIKPLPIQGTRTYPLDDEVKQGVARPIPPTPEQIRDKLHEILPSRQFPKPLGVILKPTFNNNNNPATSQDAQSQQQQQQQLPKSTYVTRDMPVYQLRAPYHRLTTGGGDLGDESLNAVDFGRILLVPCCFAVMVALLALASLHYKTTKGEERAGVEECGDEGQMGPDCLKF